MAKISGIPNFGAFFEAFRGESDRAAAVLAAAYEEAALERIFKARLIASASKNLFEYRGPLGDFAGKISLAYALGWISADTANDLHIIRDIRNDFAHDFDHTLSFDTQSVSDRTKNLRILDRMRRFIEHATENSPGRPQMLESLFSTSRLRFQTAIASIELILQKAIHAGTNAAEMSDEWVVSGPFEFTLQPGESAQISMSGVIKEP